RDDRGRDRGVPHERTMTPLEGRSEVRARALVLGERIDLRTLETTRRLAVGPLVLAAGTGGCVALFHYGAAVLFGLAPVEEASCLAGLQAFVRQPVPTREFEEVVLRVAPIETESVDNGVIAVREISLERLQVVADILAKSVVLAQYEASIASVF